MPVITAMFFFILPIVATGAYMVREYGFDTVDFKSKWYKSRVTAIIFFVIYALYILSTSYLNEFLYEIEYYFIYPSLALSSIIFAKHSEWRHTGDFMHLLGWLALLYILGWVIVEETMIYT